VRVCLFTDTLADVNGVSRFIRAVAAEAVAAARHLTVLTSTRLPLPPAPNIENFPPRFARPMPRYEQLELALPPVASMMSRARELRPDAVHISTPGPVGLAGLLAARRLRVPVLGVYHTDFPAYVDHLFGDWLLTRASRALMRPFYGRFAAIFTRSGSYEPALASLGIAAHRVFRLNPGIDTSHFQPSFRDPTIWDLLNIPREGPKVLYVGRVSIEKNLPLLASAWKRLLRSPHPTSHIPHPTLVVVGDGPYREKMQHDLAGLRAHFPGFRHGPELSAIYASADLFAFPSATDTLGQVVMEAQSAGLPVLVSNEGGPQEVILPNETGLILPAHSPQAWSEALRSLLSSPARLQTMSAAAHAHIQPMTIRRSFDHFWQVHEATVAAHAGRQNATSPLVGGLPLKRI
jgi:glycosyltransferase involved in cell wall biosynthesis